MSLIHTSPDVTWRYVGTMWVNDYYFVKTYCSRVDGRYCKDLYYTWSQNTPGRGSRGSSRRYRERQIHSDTVYYYSGEYSLTFLIGPELDLCDPRDAE